MIKIGDFSHLSQVPVKTLRYYDEIGLFKPAQIDPFTNYRYYTLDQLPRLNRILALKELGLSLEQIAQMLHDELTPEQIRGMFKLKQAELQQHIQSEQEKLARLESRLRQIEMEGKMSEFDAVIKHIDAQRVISFRQVVPDGSGISQLLSQVFGVVFTSGIKFTGPPITMYHSHENGFDTELVFPVDESFSGELPSVGGTQMTLHVIPAQTVASTIHHGSYETIAETYNALSQWVSAQGYDYVGPIREIYLTSPGDTPNPADYLTEVQIPVEKVRVNA